jgi:hypothetical protein
MNTSVTDIDKENEEEDLGYEEEIGIQELEKELREAVDDANAYICRCGDSYDTRWCLWAGQTPDGRKRRDALGKEPFPWEGASDTRIRIADEVINDNALIVVSALQRARLQGVPVESGDARAAAAMTTFLKRLMTTEMSETLRLEVPLLANYQEGYGHAVMAVTWDQEVRMQKLPLKLSDMTRMAQEGVQQRDPQSAIALMMLEAMWDDSRGDEVAAWLISIYPDLKARQAKQVIADLRTQGASEVPMPQLVKNTPCWTALRPFRDVFYPANTCDLARARWIAWREVLSPGDLRARILTHDYEKEVVEEACKKACGSSVLDDVRYDVGDTKVKVIDEMKGMVEVFCLYRRVTDEEGFTTIRVSEFTPGCSEKFKEDYEQNYAHREYPFVEFVHNRTERILIENRGVAELCDTQQTEVKTQRDYRSDRSSIAILPPVKVTASRPNLQLTFGPASQVPVRKSDDVNWMQPPNPDPETVALEQEVKRDVNNYFARWAEGVHPTRQALYSQKLTDDFLGGFRKVARQTVTLCRQYLSNEEFARITGVPLPFAIEDEMTMPENFDIMIDFNAGDLNFELTLAKLKTVNEVILPADTLGVIDRAKYVEWAMRAVDPTLAEDVVKPQQVATNQEIEDEQVQYSKIYGGTEPEMKTGGQNAALRLQVLQTILQRNPNVQQRYAGDEIFKKMMDARMQHFQFQLQQQQNAQIGRMGAMPALQEVNKDQGQGGGGLGAMYAANGSNGGQTA